MPIAWDGRGLEDLVKAYGLNEDRLSALRRFS